jgi:hypothetical protein
VYQRDYIQKQLELLGLFFATLFGKKNVVPPDDLLEAIDLHAQKLLGKEYLHLLDETVLFQPNQLITTKQDIFKYEAAARYLYEKFIILENQTKLISAEKSRDKSIALYEYVKRLDKTFSLEREKILEDLKRRRN